MLRIFTPGSPYTKRARFLAVLWTLLILIACFTPSAEIPKVDVPLMDKWTHLVLFGVFTFLWCCARPTLSFTRFLLLALISITFGAVIEYLQGFFTSLGRSMEFMDGVADAVGGLMGIGLFVIIALIAKRKTTG